MDPALIAAIGTFGGGFLLKGAEVFFGKKKKQESAPVEDEIVASQVLALLEKPVENDWSDLDFVQNVHDRQRDERMELGKEVTVCNCRRCVTARQDAAIRKHQKQLDSLLYESKTFRDRKKAEANRLKRAKYNDWAKDKEKTWIKGAYEFKVSTDLVPDYAHLVLIPPTDPYSEPKFCPGQFSWKDPDTGGMKFVRAMGIERANWEAKAKRPDVAPEVKKSLEELKAVNASLKKVLHQMDEKEKMWKDIKNDSNYVL
jgi:hypothetical protein